MSYTCWKCQGELFPTTNECLVLINYDSLLKHENPLTTATTIDKQEVQQLGKLRIARYVHKSCFESQPEAGDSSLVPNLESEGNLFISRFQIHPLSSIRHFIQHSNGKIPIYYK